MQDLTPIPISPKQRWREFRIAYLPIITFGAMIGVTALMWRSYVQPSAIIGEVETIHADIISSLDGTVQELHVDWLQPVTNGQVLAVVAPYDDEQIQSELLATEADLRVMKARMDLDQTRNLDSLARLNADLLTEKLDLELARIRLQYAENEFQRAESLLENRLISRGSGIDRNDFGYDVTVRDRDSLRVEIAAREKTVAGLETALTDLRTFTGGSRNPGEQAIEDAISAHHARIARLQSPLSLVSPIDGFVSKIDYRAGERVPAGIPILIVSKGKSDRILAWVNQPVNLRPQIGDIVEVRRMGMGSVRFEAKIIQVGTQLEPVSPMLRSPTANPERIEIGLPLLVQADAVRELLPGEPVILRVLR
jgi:multidrug resistance efflux pump